MEQYPGQTFFNAVMHGLVSRELLNWRNFMLLAMNHLQQVARSSGDVGPFVYDSLVKDFQDLFSKELERIREREANYLTEKTWAAVTKYFTNYVEIFGLEIQYETALRNVRFWEYPPPGEAPDPEAIKENWKREAKTLKSKIDSLEQSVKALADDYQPIIKNHFFSPTDN